MWRIVPMRWEVNPSRNEANARAAAAERWSQVHSTTVRSATENVRSPQGQVPKPAHAARVPRTLSAPTDPRPSTVSSLAPARAPPGATALRVPPSVPVNPASSANASLVDAAVAGAQWRATAAEMIPEFETTLGAPKGPAQPAESKPAPASAEPAAAVPVQKIPSGFRTTLKAIEAEHRKPRRATRTFSSTKERETFLVTEEVEALLPLLPEQVCVAMLGGALGMAQVPSDERRVALLRASFAKSAGLEGARVKGLRAMLCAVRTYAATELHLPDRKKADAACFPMSATLVATVIADADVKARTRGSGSQKGATVGHKLRETFIYAAEKLLWPIEVPRVVLNAAAPKPTLLKRSKAGTLPLGRSANSSTSLGAARSTA
jgi:hypothetical protein